MAWRGSACATTTGRSRSCASAPARRREGVGYETDHEVFFFSPSSSAFAPARRGAGICGISSKLKYPPLGEVKLPEVQRTTAAERDGPLHSRGPRFPGRAGRVLLSARAACSIRPTRSVSPR